MVYALSTLQPPGPGTDCGIYDTNANNRRKVQFESELAALVVQDPSLVQGALRKVNQGIVQLMKKRPKQDDAHRLASEAIAKMMYSDRHFGVLGSAQRKPRDSSQKKQAYQHVWDSILQREKCESVATVILLHQAFNQEVFPKLSSSNPNEDIATLTKQTNDSLRPKELFDNRGRVERPGKAQRELVDRVGIFAQEDTAPTPDKVRKHSRAVDGFMADTVSPPPLNLQMKDLEMPFVAGPSGSAGSAIACARIAANLSGEDLKQYALACVAYLVGGGSHGFHEVMVIARLAGMAYTDGNYVSALPDEFKSSPKWRELKAKYADVIFDQWLKGTVATPKPTTPMNMMRRITPTLVSSTQDQNLPFALASSGDGSSSEKKRPFDGGSDREWKRHKS
ncbi:MAG: hypothetical protein ABW123_00290 [Cystobacter sp.]